MWANFTVIRRETEKVCTVRERNKRSMIVPARVVPDISVTSRTVHTFAKVVHVPATC